jgi:hypothetical protein
MFLNWLKSIWIYQLSSQILVLLGWQDFLSEVFQPDAIQLMSEFISITTII